MSCSFRSSTYPWYDVSGKVSGKNLEQWINIKFCIKTCRSASETLAQLTLVYGVYAVKKSSPSGWHRRSKEGQEDVQDDPRSKQPKIAKDRHKCEQSTHLGALRSKIRCETIIRRRLRESFRRKRRELWPYKCILHHDNAPAHGALRVLANSNLRNPLQKSTIHLIHLT
jgi:hypothetical protein